MNVNRPVTALGPAQQTFYWPAHRLLWLRLSPPACRARKSSGLHSRLSAMRGFSGCRHRRALTADRKARAERTESYGAPPRLPCASPGGSGCRRRNPLRYSRRNVAVECEGSLAPNREVTCGSSCTEVGAAGGKRCRRSDALTRHSQKQGPDKTLTSASAVSFGTLQACTQLPSYLLITFKPKRIYQQKQPF